MNTFHWIIFLLLLSLFFACDPTNPKEEVEDRPEYAALLSKVFDGSLFDYFQNHNQALDVIEALTQDGLLQKKPATLIHFDSHSDMYRLSRKKDINPGTYGQGYADYVNTLILDGTVEEIYWVLPDESHTPENRGIFWNPETGTDEYFVMFNGPKTQTFYVDEREKDIYFDKPDGYNVNPAWYRTVTFHKVILEDLKLERHDRPVIIDIDADYFSNNGVDTGNEMEVPYKEQNITRFLTTLENLGIRPMLTMGALSPGYTFDEDKIALERFFQDIGASAQKGDYLIGYKHHDKYGEEIWGSNIRRRSKDLYQGIYELRYIDLRTSTPDYLTPVNDSSLEYKKGIKKIQLLLGISGQKAATLLSNWDKEDGIHDSAVHYHQIEQNVQNRNGSPSSVDENSLRLKAEKVGVRIKKDRYPVCE